MIKLELTISNFTAVSRSRYLIGAIRDLSAKILSAKKDPRCTTFKAICNEKQAILLTNLWGLEAKVI